MNKNGVHGEAAFWTLADASVALDAFKMIDRPGAIFLVNRYSASRTALLADTAVDTVFGTKGNFSPVQQDVQAPQTDTELFPVFQKETEGSFCQV